MIGLRARRRYGPDARRIGTVKPVGGSTACWWALNRDDSIGTAAGIIEQVAFGRSDVDGWPTAVVMEAARLDVAAARRRLQALAGSVDDE